MVIANQSHAETLKLSVTPTAVELGKSCTLTWSSSGQSGYLVGYGLVEARGSLEITPSSSKVYLLVIDNKGKPEVATARVEVKGQRGGLEYPSIEQFNVSAPDSESSAKYTQFLSIVEKTMHGMNGFNVEGEFKPSRPYVVLYTDLEEKSELRSLHEQGRNKHRVAYCVVVYPPTETEPSVVKFDVKALVQTRPIAESEWRPSEDPEMAKLCAEKLKGQLLISAREIPK